MRPGEAEPSPGPEAGRAAYTETQGRAITTEETLANQSQLGQITRPPKTQAECLSPAGFYFTQTGMVWAKSPHTICERKKHVFSDCTERETNYWIYGQFIYAFCIH